MSAAHQLGFFTTAPASGAVLSDCRRYRYRLWRRWGPGPAALFIMLNPSTADAVQADPTIRKCIGFAKRWGKGAIDVVNLFAWRATNPADLAPLADPAGPENDGHIAEAVRESAVAVAAWGVAAGVPKELVRVRVARVLALLEGRQVMCLGRADGGAPRHPLMLSYTTQLVPLND